MVAVYLRESGHPPASPWWLWALAGAMLVGAILLSIARRRR
jgi:hypothetical protein